MRRKVQEPWPPHYATAGAATELGGRAFALRLGRHVVLHVAVSDDVVILDCFRRIVAGGARLCLEISITVDAASKASAFAWPLPADGGRNVAHRVTDPPAV